MTSRQVKKSGRPDFSPAYDRPQSAGQTKQPKLAPKTRLGLWAAAIFGVVVIGLWLGKIQTVNVTGVDNPQAIQSQVQSLLHGRQDYIYWFSGSKLAADLQHSNSQISGADIKLNWLARTVNINAVGRRAVMAWQSGGRVYLIDQQGVAMSTADSQAARQLPEVTDQTNLDVSLGQPVAPSTFVDFVQALNAKLPQVANLKYSGGSVAETTNELLANTSGGFAIRFDTTRSIDDQLAEVKTLLSHGIHPSQYIDVRLAYKAYYK